MIEGLGLLGIRKEAATLKKLKDLFGSTKASDIYSQLLDDSLFARDVASFKRASRGVSGMQKRTPVYKILDVLYPDMSAIGRSTPYIGANPNRVASLINFHRKHPNSPLLPTFMDWS